MPTLRVLIGGELRGAADEQTIDAVNAATGEVLGRIPRCSAADVDDAVRAARAAFRAWAERDPQERAETVRRFADRPLCTRR